MKNIFKNKKFLIPLIILVVIGIIIFYKFKHQQTPLRYLLTQAKRDNLSVTVSQTGTISPLEELNLKAKASGEVVYLNMKNGQKVKRGELLLKIDSTDQEKTVRNLELDLESALISLNKAKQTTQIDEKSLKNQAINYLGKIFDDWKEYLNNFEEIFNQDISSYKTNHNYLFEYYSSIVKFYFPYDIDYGSILKENYELLKKNYNPKSSLIMKLNSQSSLDEVESVLNSVLDDAKLLNDTVRVSGDLLTRYYSTISDYNLKPLIEERNVLSDKNTISTLSTSIYSNLSNLLTISKNITSYKEGLKNNYPYDVYELEIAYQKKKEDLEEAKKDLKNYYLYAPFDGILANVNIKKGDDVTSGMTVAQLITSEKIAEVSFNEVDALKIKIGQKAKLTFDALPNLEIKGEVVEIDPIGTESQGVITYNVKIALLEDNENIKPSMSVNAEIIIDSKENVLVLPNSAIKTFNNRKYVEIISGIELNERDLRTGITLKSNPQRKFIKTGLSNDLMTEILEGVEEGEYVISSTISQSNKNAQINQSNFLFQQRTNVGSQLRFQMPR